MDVQGRYDARREREKVRKGIRDRMETMKMDD